MTQNSDPEISCPECQHRFTLTTSLAAPLLAKTRAEYDERLKTQSETLSRDRKSLLEQQTALAHASANLEEQVTERLAVQRAALIAQEQKRVRSTMGVEINKLKEDQDDLKYQLSEKEKKLAEAQQQQALFIVKERELNEQKRELDITIAKRVDADSQIIRAKAQADAKEAERLKIAEKEQTIVSMQRQIDELKRRSEQGSQQLQGEVLELDFEAQLIQRFPLDRIEAVAKGELGADLIQHVMSADGQTLGRIVWELKRTKTWSDSWLAKLRDDQRRITAEIAIVVSSALPKGVETFDLIDGVYISHPKVSMTLATLLRQSLADLARVKILNEGQSSKVEQIYNYLTGPKFKNRVDVIVENFRAEQEALDKERKFMNRQWAKRDQHLLQVLEATTGMYGDMQGIAGSSMQSINALEHLVNEEDGNDQ